MIEYRAITEGDVPEVTAFALETLGKVHLDMPVCISHAKVRAWVELFAISGDAHYQRAAFRDGRCVAALAMYVNEMPFFERAEGIVMLCFSIEPGAGARLVRGMMKWVREHLHIRRVVWMMNEHSQRLAKMIWRRYGFRCQLDTLVYYKG